MDSGLGPREYVVEPTAAPPWHARRRVRTVGAVVLLLAVGGGAYGIASAFSGGSSTSASTGAAAGVPAAGGGPGAVGTAPTLRGIVTATSADGVTMTTRGGSETVATTSATTYRTGTGATASFSSIKKGDILTVVTTGSSAPYTAKTVLIGAAGGRFGGGPGAPGGFAGKVDFGTVTAVGTNSFTITPRAFGSSTSTSPLTVDVTSSTTFRSRGSGTAPTFASIKVGDTVIVTGTTSGSTVTATTIAVLPAGTTFGGNGGPGGGPGGGGFGGGAAPAA